MKKISFLVLTITVIALACSQPSSSPSPEPSATLPASAPSASGVAEPSPLPHRLRPPIPTTPPAPPVVDTRSPDRLAMAACYGGKCKGSVAGKRLLAASATQPIIPPSWTVPNWYIDPANSIGCASDSNSGTSATCTGGCSGSVCTSGVGPLLTYAQLAQQRWGTYSPRLQQITTRTWLSPQSGTADPVYSLERMEGGAYLLDTCPLGSAQTVGTGTIGSVSGGSGTRSGNAVLQAAFTITGSPALTQGMLVQNTTHASYSVLSKFVSGTTWKLQQPLAAVSIPYNVAISVPAEVQNWTNGDPVTVFAPVTVDFADVETTVTTSVPASNFNAAHFINHCNFFQPAANSPPVVLNNVQLSELAVMRAASIVGTDSITAAVTGINTLFTANVYGSAAVGAIFMGGPTFIGGAFAGNNTAIGNVTLDGDVAFVSGGNGIYLSGFNFLNLVIVDTSTRLNLVQGVAHVATGNYSASVLYGAGTVNLEGQSRLDYPAGASGAANSLLIANMDVNLQTKTCIAQPGAAAIGACNQTLSAANLDTNGGATSDCMLALGGGAFCNYGP